MDTGPNCVITTHLLRKTVMCVLGEPGTPDTAKSLRTGHFCMESVRTYQQKAATRDAVSKVTVSKAEVILRKTRI